MGWRRSQELHYNFIWCNKLTSQTTIWYYISNDHSFQVQGTNFVEIGTEEISYTGISASNELTGVTRGSKRNNTASHGAGDTVTNASNYVAWGEANLVT